MYLGLQSSEIIWMSFKMNVLIPIVLCFGVGIIEADHKNVAMQLDRHVDI